MYIYIYIYPNSLLEDARKAKLLPRPKQATLLRTHVSRPGHGVGASNGADDRVQGSRDLGSRGLGV